MRDQKQDGPLDFQKMCRQAEYEHETRKLERLMDRLKRQLSQGENGMIKPGAPKPPVSAMVKNQDLAGVRGRLSFFER